MDHTGTLNCTCTTYEWGLYSLRWLSPRIIFTSNFAA